MSIPYAPVGRFYIQADFIEASLCRRVNKCLRPVQMETKGFAQLSKQIWELFRPRQIYFEANKLGPDVLKVSNYLGM